MPHKTERAQWATDAAALGLKLEQIALVTNRSYAAVYRYATGTRNPPAEWLAQVAAIIATARLDARRPRDAA